MSRRVGSWSRRPPFGTRPGSDRAMEKKDSIQNLAVI
jgi:hypothetical protein